MFERVLARASSLLKGWYAMQGPRVHATCDTMLQMLTERVPFAVTANAAKRFMRTLPNTQGAGWCGRLVFHGPGNRCLQERGWSQEGLRTALRNGAYLYCVIRDRRFGCLSHAGVGGYILWHEAQYLELGMCLAASRCVHGA